MIVELKIAGYKCLLMERPVRLSKLNVLVGANASGKSTLIQSLLLLRQSCNSEGRIEELHLSGELYEAGTANDALHPAAEHMISVGLRCDGDAATREFLFQSNREDPLRRRLQETARAHTLPRVIFDKSGGFCYLNAERVGPRVSYSLAPDDASLAGSVGKYGEHTAGRLARSREEVNRVDSWDPLTRTKLELALFELDGIDVSEPLLESEGRLDLVTNSVLGWLIPNSAFEPAEDEEKDSAPLRFLRDPLGTKVKTRPTHVGFGLTYTLPVIVAGLSLNSGGLMLLENPEAHLHPFGQSRIGAFLAALAGAERQIVLETHSDHVVNGIRLAIKKGLIPASDVLFSFFTVSEDGSSCHIEQISADSDGALADWPRGFMDQLERDLSRL